MIDHVLGRPSVKSRRLQVLVVLAFWSTYLFRGHRHGPPIARFFSRLFSQRLTTWQIVVTTILYQYAARNFSTLVGLASPDPLSNMYDKKYFRATWILTALDAGFWTAMKIRRKWMRDFASMVFSVFYLFAAESADEKVRKVRGNLTVEHLRVSWNKGATPYLRFIQSLLGPRFSRWPPRRIRIQRPATSEYKEAIDGWLYFDGSLDELESSGIRKLVLDLPGGGFVAMDPRCNDDRLLSWAAQTGLPILSLDYKKAPEHPYPYALNEAFDTYTKLIHTKGRCIGLSGKEPPRIVVSGDSAGGNLATAMTLMITESGLGPTGGSMGQPELPVPDGLILFYPGLDMNIGNWMSDEQMALIKDRRMRNTNKDVVKRKSMQYSAVAGTTRTYTSDGTPPDSPNMKPVQSSPGDDVDNSPEAEDPRTPAPEYAHTNRTSFFNQPLKPPVASPEPFRSDPVTILSDTTLHPTRATHQPTPVSTRLAMSSMISYFNDRVLAPEMMRAMIILYVGPHNRPDFSQDYHLSPILAPNTLLARFPKTYFLTGERDPLVDDTLVFAGRLRRVKAAQFASGGRRLEYRDADAQAPGFNADRDVAEVVLVPGISHGFLQFPSIYPPAWKLMARAGRWIEDAFVCAEVREGERRRALLHTPSQVAAGRGRGRSGSGRGRARSDSSGEDGEDAGLEMTVRVRERPNGGAETNGERGGGAKRAGARNGNGGRANHKRHGTGDSELKLRLPSEEDLLSRRMGPLAGVLTGTHGDDE